MKTTTDSLPPDGFSRLPEVLKRIPISRTRFYEGVKRGEFPAPVRLTENVSAWRNRDVLALIERLSREGAPDAR